MTEPLLPNGARLLDLPKFTDERGSLTYVEQQNHLPFELRRAYYIYDVPGDEVRGEHAHIDLEQVLVAASGRFDVVVDDGEDRRTVTLDAPDEGLYLPGMTWRAMTNFSEDAVCLVFASEYYDEDDYVHEYDEFAERAANTRVNEG